MSKHGAFCETVSGGEFPGVLQHFGAFFYKTVRHHFFLDILFICTLGAQPELLLTKLIMLHF